MSLERLVRPEIRNLRPYVTASEKRARVRLNANELPWTGCAAGHGDQSLNRYPAVRPAELREALACHYGVAAENLLVTRGSSEAIDLLIRACCRAGRDSVLVSPPTFAMYRVYADIQGATTLSALVHPTDDFRLDVSAVLDSCQENTKLVFVCSPNNPTGTVVPAADIAEIARTRAHRSIVVVDEAYEEFSGAGSLAASIGEFANLVVLRTLSKALGLAGARCGALIGPAELVGWLDGMLAPYALATPVIDSVMQALSPDNVADARRVIAQIVCERERVRKALAGLPAVTQVWPSRANFLLVRFRNLDAAMTALRAAGILVRDFPDEPLLAACARITVGSREENDFLLAALRDHPEA